MNPSLLLCILACLPAQNLPNRTHFDKTHSQVLRMGLDAWMKYVDEKFGEMPARFDASCFYLDAAIDLNGRILANKPKKTQTQIKAVLDFLHRTNADMYAAEKAAIGGGSAQGWGVENNGAAIAIEETGYKILTGKAYHEDPLSREGKSGDLAAWKRDVRKMTDNDQDTDELLRSVDQDLEAVRFAAAELSSDDKGDVDGLVTRLADYWYKHLHLDDSERG